MQIIMKKILIMTAAIFFFAAIAAADERPVDAKSLPSAALTFINGNFPGEQIIYAAKGEDMIYPDYNVTLSNGVFLEFYNDGAFEKIESKNGVPVEMIPIQIVEFVKVRYPDAYFVEYEVTKRHYEVKLSNRLELMFSKSYNLMKIDD